MTVHIFQDKAAKSTKAIQELFLLDKGSAIYKHKDQIKVVGVQVPFGGQRKGMWAAHIAMLKLLHVQG